MENFWKFSFDTKFGNWRRRSDFFNLISVFLMINAFAVFFHHQKLSWEQHVEKFTKKFQNGKFVKWKKRRIQNFRNCCGKKFCKSLTIHLQKKSFWVDLNFYFWKNFHPLVGGGSSLLMRNEQFGNFSSLDWLVFHFDWPGLGILGNSVELWWKIRTKFNASREEEGGGKEGPPLKSVSKAKEFLAGKKTGIGFAPWKMAHLDKVKAKNGFG